MSDSKQDIIQVFREKKRGLWRFGGGSKEKLPEAGPDVDFYTVTALSGEDRELNRVSRDDAEKALGRDENSAILVLKKSSCEMALSFSGILKDSQGHAWDLQLNGSCSVSDIRNLLGKFGFNSVTPEAPLSDTMLESWLAEAVRHKIKDAVRDTSISDILEKDALPTSWWESQLNKWLAGAGLICRITTARWESAEAARAEAERIRQQDMERIARERERQLQAENREAKARADYAKEKARIEADRKLSQKEQAHQLQVLELKHRKELLAAEAEMENARRAVEQAALEHEVTVARLRHDLKSVGEGETRLAEAHEQHAALATTLEKATAVLDQLGRISEPLLQQLVSRDSGDAHQAAERLVSPEFGVSAAALAALGFGVANQSLVETLNGKQTKDSQSVQLSKADLTTRDIGTARVKALPIRRSLQFKVVSRRAGYVAILNLGTSGAVYLQVPSALTGGQHLQVVEDKPYFVPGEELFPWKWDYREEGPAGWEHMVAIVSDEPVIPDEIVARSTPESPIVRLTPEEMEGLFTSLEELPAESWTAGVLSFLVEGK
ncbi:MAG: DUF4384 domain-containing protein [Thermodesulfobacteriota bacterium]